MPDLMTVLLIALPVAALVLAVAAAWVSYRAGYDSGRDDTRAAHALQALDRARAAAAGTVP